MTTVVPETFTKVDYRSDEIAAVFDEVAARVAGLPDGFEVALRIDEETPTTRMAVESLDPCVLLLESGALEDTKHPRTFGVEMASASIGRLLFEVADRIDPDFSAPPVGEPADLGHRAAWDVYCYGRVSRLGYRVFKPKHRYNFRNRHGFSDRADAAFDRLWDGVGLTWDEIVAMGPEPRA